MLKVDAKPSEPGYCSHSYDEEATKNPEEIVTPTASEHWGFCHISCLKPDIYGKGLKKVILTTLSDNLCQKFGKIVEQDDLKLIANTAVELCGAFVNKLNVNLVNYTIPQNKKKQVY